MKLEFDEARIRAALEAAWSLDTAAQWTAENPANGQCNVTAVVVHDVFGGYILRTRLPGVWHYYNRIEGKSLDLTDSQFTRPGARFAAPQRYDDEVTDRDTAMVGIPTREYDALKTALLDQLAE